MRRYYDDPEEAKKRKMKRSQPPYDPQRLKKQAEDLRKGISEKRRGIFGKGHVTYLTVGMCGAKAVGNAQKYPRLTALETVSTEDTSLDGIKAACSKYFKRSKEACFVMLSDKGPSVVDIKQIPKLNKPIYCRFVDQVLSTPAAVTARGSASNLVASRSAQSLISQARYQSSTPASARVVPSAASARVVPSAHSEGIVRSISMTSLFAMGKVIDPSVRMMALDLEEFSVATKSWVPPVTVKFLVEVDKFASGTFRDAFHAKQVGSILPRRSYVLKKFNEDTVEGINVIQGESVENAMRKNVQAHMVARALAQQFTRNVCDGESLIYEKGYFAKTLNNDVYFIEPYLEGSFKKYINNTGQIFKPTGVDPDHIAKAEAFSHYSYVKCEKSGMVLDIQGCGVNLTDPEIATKSLRDEECNWLYGSGNLNKEAIKTFFNAHVCNAYCHILQLPVEDGQDVNN